MPERSAGLPPTVVADVDEPLVDYLGRRLAQHTLDSYAGVPISKFPEDLRTYEHLLWLDDPDVVLELGVHRGGSTLWLRDRLNALARYRGRRPGRVVAVELDSQLARDHLSRADPGYEQDIELIDGDVRDPQLPDRVAAVIAPGTRCLVIEDTAHTYETTRAALHGFARFVMPGGFLVVEDGVVDDERLRVREDWPRGVQPAIAEWLAGEGAGFVSRPDLELYGISCHPRGFLQRQR